MRFWVGLQGDGEALAKQFGGDGAGVLDRLPQARLTARVGIDADDQRVAGAIRPNFLGDRSVLGLAGLQIGGQAASVRRCPSRAQEHRRDGRATVNYAVQQIFYIPSSDLTDASRTPLRENVAADAPRSLIHSPVWV